jgi:hypothetical protein
VSRVRAPRAYGRSPRCRLGAASAQVMPAARISTHRCRSNCLFPPRRSACFACISSYHRETDGLPNQLSPQSPGPRTPPTPRRRPDDGSRYIFIPLQREQATQLSRRPAPDQPHPKPPRAKEPATRRPTARLLVADFNQPTEGSTSGSYRNCHLTGRRSRVESRRGSGNSASGLRRPATLTPSRQPACQSPAGPTGPPELTSSPRWAVERPVVR